MAWRAVAEGPARSPAVSSRRAGERHGRVSNGVHANQPESSALAWRRTRRPGVQVEADELGSPRGAARVKSPPPGRCQQSFMRARNAVSVHCISEYGPASLNMRVMRRACRITRVRLAPAAVGRAEHPRCAGRAHRAEVVELRGDALAAGVLHHALEFVLDQSGPIRSRIRELLRSSLTRSGW